MRIIRIYKNITSQSIAFVNPDTNESKILALPGETFSVDNGEVTRENGEKFILPSPSVITLNSAYLKLVSSFPIEPPELDSESVSSPRVDHPTYYQNNASGIECIDVIEDFDFCTGNAIKYLWRCGKKKESGMDDKEKQIEDLKKAIWYIERKLKKLQQ